MGDEPRGMLQFRMLGPLEAWRGETPLRLGGERQRALLALLLVHANELVRTEQLVDQLLGGEVSDSALNTTRVAVSRLRRLLEDGDGAGVLVTRAGGYVLNAGPEQLDVARFERLLAEGRGLLAGGDAAAAAARLREALALWRGPPLVDLAVLEFVQPEIRRLEELRLLAVMERIDADLMLGADAELIGELEGLVASNPLQERLRAQLMLALYRTGRQAEGLEVYRQVSELLRGELGLEPSRGLQELERQVLRQDPALELVPGPVTATGSATEERAVCPYKGLASFDRSDAEYFCGRERIVSDLVARLAESTLVGIVGPSGIGKSSLLRAGLLSALGAGALPGSASWQQVLVRPGERPCAELARALGGEELDVVLAELKPGDRMVLAVDQLEELFTVCEHESERAAFLDRLASAACDIERRVLSSSRCARTSTAAAPHTPGLRSCSARTMCWSGRCRVRSWRGRSSCRRLAPGWTLSERLSRIWLAMWPVSRVGCRCCQRCCSSCGGCATGACCALSVTRRAAACGGRSLGSRRTPMCSSIRTKGGLRADCCYGSHTATTARSSVDACRWRSSNESMGPNRCWRR